MRNNFDGFQNSGNNPNMNQSNTMFMSSNFRNGQNMSQNNFNLMNNTPSAPLAQSQSFNRKLHVQLTSDENMLFNKLYNMLDTNNQGRIMGKPAANFMKTSGLDKNILKQIWLIAAQNSNTQMDKEEFFVALRLIALAQNNMPISSESIERNNPIPPLPQFNLNSNNNMNQNNNQNNFGNRNNQDNFNNNNPNMNYNNNQNNQNQNNNFNNNNQISIFDISEREKINYKSIFDNQKEPNLEKIRAHNAIIVWKDNNADDMAIRTVAEIIKPLEQKGFLNLKEFQVACHLINISKNVQLPPKLPLSLVNFLGRNNNNMNNINNFQNMKFNNTTNNNNMANNAGDFNRTNTNSTFSQYLNTNNDLNESNFSLHSRPLANAPFGNKNDNNINQAQNNNKIQDLLKREEDLTKKNEVLKDKIILAKNKVEELLKEISSIQNMQNNINNELSSLKQEINIIKNNGNLNNASNASNNIPKKNTGIDLNNNLIKKNIDDIGKNMRYDSSDLNENNNLKNNFNINNNDNKQNLENQNKEQNLMDLMNKMDLQNIGNNNTNSNPNQNNLNKQNENKLDDFDLDFNEDFKNGPKDINPYELGNDNKKEEGNSAQKNDIDDFSF